MRRKGGISMQLSGWGNHPVISGELHTPRSEDEVASLIASNSPLIARGNGRSYGDPALSSTCTVSMLKLNRMLDFDPNTGDLVAEAGTLLSDILSVFVPRGWFPPVTPGTQFVTLGGMVACDVHGKNHPKDGSFGAHVQWIDLMGSDATTHRCSPTQNTNLFWDTIGGMGLTGIVLRVCIRLRKIASAFITQRRIVTQNLHELLRAFEESEGARYRVAWVDCLAQGDALGRSLLDVGEHAELEDLRVSQREAPFTLKPRRQLTMPLTPPVTPLNALTVRAFNELYFRKGALAAGGSVLDYQSYFYPLDAILHWNRMYGRKGFAQYQCVLPKATATDGLKALLDKISASGIGSFLSVLKRLGPCKTGRLSFPCDGYTLALDFPWHTKTQSLLNLLDEITLEHGGWVYLAKDSRVSRAAFEQMQPNLTDFQDGRVKSGAAGRFQSLQSERLGL